MTINAVPKRVSSSQLPCGYKCPIDSVSESSEEHGEWVECPLVSKEFISLGSCLDLQDLARSEEFYSDPYLDMFETVASKEGSSVKNVRRACLRHQADILTEMVSESESDSKQVRQTLFRVNARLSEESDD